MSDPRVVSLAPSATATVTALGAAEILVGVTNHCDLGRRGRHARDGFSRCPRRVADPDLDRVADLDPDAVLTSDGLQSDLADDCRERGFAVRHREPATLDEVVATFAARGADVGRSEAGDRRCRGSGATRPDRRRGRGSPAPDRLL